MRVLLCIPVSKTAYQATPDLGLGYLATALLKNGHEVKILDAFNLALDYNGFERHLKDYDPEVVGMKVFSRDLVSAKKCLEIVKRQRKKIITMVGGPHPSTSDPQECMDYLGDADYAFRGEGDYGLPMLLDKLISGDTNAQSLMDVPGLIFRSEGKVTANAQQFIEDLDSLGRPAWELMDPREYTSKEAFGFQIDKFPAAYIIATRGCPYQCSFCASSLITGKKVRYRSVENVISEMNELIDKFGVEVFIIVDDNIALNKNYIVAFCEAILKMGRKIEWHCPYGVRLDSLDPEVVRKMEESGCKSLSLGIESGDDDVLKHMKKQLTVQKVEEKVRMIKENSKLHLHGNFILGYPTETKETVLKTIRLAKRLPLDVAAFTPFRPTPGTPIYAEMEKHGLVSDIDWNMFSSDNLLKSYSNVGYKELMWLWRRAYVEFYFRPRIIWGMLRSIRSVQQAKWLLRRIRSRILHF